MQLQGCTARAWWQHGLVASHINMIHVRTTTANRVLYRPYSTTACMRVHLAAVSECVLARIATQLSLVMGIGRLSKLAPQAGTPTTNSCEPASSPSTPKREGGYLPS